MHTRDNHNAIRRLSAGCAAINPRAQREHDTTRLMLISMMIFSAMVCSPAARADEVNLRASVRLTHDSRTVRLGDIAELIGPEAQKLAELSIAEAGEQQHVLELGVHQIRAALDEAGVHWGKINLNGGRVIVRVRRGEIQAPVDAMQPVSIHQDGRAEQRSRRATNGDEITAATIVRQATMRGVIARLFVQNLKIDPSDLRLTFERDARDVLDLTTDDCQFQVEPHSSLLSEIVQLQVRCWSSGTVTARHELVVRPLVAVNAITPVRPISRSERLMESDLETQRLWLPPQEAALLSDMAGAVGKVAGRQLRPGDLVRLAHVRPDIVIQRGDLVDVHCLVGGSVITLQAEARQEGSLGDSIELRKIGERQTFLARITAPGQAIVDLARR